MTRIRSTIVVTVLAVLCGGVLLSCAPTKPMTLSDFRFRCRFAEEERLTYEDEIAGCDLQTQARLCDEYTIVLQSDHPNLGSCIQGCREVVDRYAAELSISSCFHFATRTRTICEQYCRQHYP